ncbi:MAG: thiamine pyrophosphate-dependent enzyme [Terracidiphilus sp.]|nr:thiamine pyrophosphate-dependent enzyme [Terracidiphilus sp.]
MISPEKLIALYTAMVKCRMTAEAAGLDPQEHPCSEAAYAAATADLERKDTLHAAPRHALAALVRGASIQRTLKALSPGRRTRKGTEDTLETACVAARRHKAGKKGAVAMAFASDAELPASVWKKALTQAARRSLPAVFVSLRAEGEAPAFLGSKSIPPECMAFGVPVITVDGNDAVAVYRVAYESLTRARQLSNPTLIDCICLDEDGIALMERFLQTRNLLTPAKKRSIRTRLRAELKTASASSAGTSKERQ